MAGRPAGPEPCRPVVAHGSAGVGRGLLGHAHCAAAAAQQGRDLGTDGEKEAGRDAVPTLRPLTTREEGGAAAGS